MRNMVLFLTLATLSTTACSNSGSSDAPAPVAAAAVTNTLLVTVSSPTVNLGGTVTVSVSGGSGTYTSAMASQGTIVQSLPGLYTFTAPVSTTSTSFDITITDSTGAMGSAIVTLPSGTTTGTAASCGGTYTLTINTNLSATMTLVEDASGNVAGNIKMVGYYYPVVGTCTTNGTAGTLTLQELVNGNTYTASVTALGGQNTLAGTLVTAGGANYPWTASSQSTSTITTTPATNCEGSFNATLGVNTATMTLVEDGTGNIAGYLLLQGYYYALGGTCTGAAISFSNFTTGSQYTGTVSGTGAAVSMAGTYIIPGGTPYNWTALSH